MFNIDIKTVLFSFVITDIVSTLVIFLLWFQNRKRVRGTTYWVFDFALQTLGLILIASQGIIPDWISVDFSNTCIIAGAILGFMGLERFLGMKSNQIYNFILLIAFALLYTWFTVYPDLAARTLCHSLAMLIICFQCAWILLHRTPVSLRKITHGIGIVFLAFCLLSIVRIIGFFIAEHTSNDYLNSRAFEALVLISYQILFILLTYSLTLMFNKRLLFELVSQENALRESETLYHSLFDNMLNGFAYCKMEYDEMNNPVDFTYIDVNKAFETQTGLKDVVGKKVSEVIPGITRTDTSLLELYGRVASGGAPEHMEVFVEALQMWFWISVYNPSSGYFVAVFDVISERKRIEGTLKESEEKFRNLFENSPVGKSITGIDGTLNVNRSFSKILGYSEEEFKTKSVKDITHPDDLQLSNNFIQSLLDKKVNQVRFEKRYISKTGNIVFADVSAFLQRGKNGDPLYFITTISDITEKKLAARALQESEKRFRSTLDNMLEGSQLIGFDWRYLYINNAAEKHNRRPKEELLGNKYMDVWPGIEETNVFAVIKKCMEERISRFLINEFVFPDGTIGWFDLSIQPVPEGVFILSSDITSRIQAKNNDDLEREVLEKLNMHTDSVEMINSILRSIQDKTGFEAVGLRLKEGDDFPYFSTVGFNEKFVEAERYLCNYDKDGNVIFDQKGDPLLECMCGNILCGRVDASKSFFTKGGSFISGNTTQLLATTSRADLLARTRNRCNSFGYESVALVPIRSGNKIIGLLQLNDHRKNIFTNEIIPFFEGLGSSIGLALNRNKAEQEISKLNEELEERVIQRTYQLEAVNRELEAFSYSVSHDLRAPLRAIHSFTSILKEDYGKALDDEGRRIAGIIESSSIHMGKLIDDLLAFSRVGRTELLYTKIDMASLVQTVYFDMTTPGERERIAFSVEKLPFAFGDATAIRQAMTNLISNAIKYSSRSVKAEISIGYNKNGSFYFVKDNGVGFDMKYVNKLFGVFQRLHSTKEFEGNGVGLAIVQRIILRHGGRTWVEGEVGKGATFYFTLPVKRLKNIGKN